MTPRPWRIKTHCKYGHARPEPRKPCPTCQSNRYAETKADPVAYEAYKRRKSDERKRHYHNDPAHRQKLLDRMPKLKDRRRKSVEELVSRAEYLAKQERYGIKVKEMKSV
jgi:hypothetical protein